MLFCARVTSPPEELLLEDELLEDELELELELLDEELLDVELLLDEELEEELLLEDELPPPGPPQAINKLAVRKSVSRGRSFFTVVTGKSAPGN